MREEAAVGCNDNVNDDEKIPTHRIWSSTSPSSMNRGFYSTKGIRLHLREVRTDVLAEAGELAHHAAADGGILGFADEQ